MRRGGGGRGGRNELHLLTPPSCRDWEAESGKEEAVVKEELVLVLLVEVTSISL